MKKLFFLAVLFPSVIFSQVFKVEEVNVSSGANYLHGQYMKIDPVVVIESEGTSNELFNKCIEWINVTYKQPNEVIKGKIEGEYVKINGAAKSMLQLSALGTTVYRDIRYTIEFKFREGRFRMEIIDLEYYIPEGAFAGWNSTDLSFRTANRKGKIDNDGIANTRRFREYFDNLAISLKEYKTGQNKAESDEKW